MSRVRMEWDMVLGYPIMVYTTFIKHGLFHVKLVKGKKGSPNGQDLGPKTEAWKEYKIQGLISKNQIANNAFKHAKRWIKEGH